MSSEKGTSSSVEKLELAVGVEQALRSQFQHERVEIQSIMLKDLARFCVEAGAGDKVSIQKPTRRSRGWMGLRAGVVVDTGGLKQDDTVWDLDNTDFWSNFKAMSVQSSWWAFVLAKAFAA